MRYEHYMYRAKGGKWPTQVICVAVESTTEVIQGTRLARRETLTGWQAIVLRRQNGEYGVHRIGRGRTEEAFWQLARFATARPGVTWIFSHQCARCWALLGLWQGVERGDVQVTGSDYRSGPHGHRSTRLGREGYLVLEDPPLIARLRVRDCPGWIQWVDTRNYGVEIGSGVPCGTNQARELAEWFVDMARAAKTYSLGSLQATAGSQALHGFRTSYLKDTIYVHCQQQVLGLEERSYHGGRCEAYRLGACPVPVWHVDFRSLYPSICSNTDLPVRLRGYVDDPARDDQLRAAREGDCIADVTVQTDEPAYPYKRGDDVLFPVGRFRTTLCGPELVDAVSHARVVTWHALARYAMAPALAAYAATLYRPRCQAEVEVNTALGAYAKRLLVCLPGKLGQRERNWEWTGEESETEPYWSEYRQSADGSWTRYRSIAWHIQREVVDGFRADSVPAIASWITSAGRMRLLGAIRIAGWDQVYYCDTDSLFVSQAGMERLLAANWIQTSALGYLQIKEGPATLRIYGQKHYDMDGRLTCAGLPRGVLSDAGDGEHYWYTEAPAGALYHGHRPEAVSTLGTYARAEPYRHGVVGTDGIITPYRLEE
jgi:hypothetical protein